MIYFITGGERSGKSNYAQQLACSLSDKPVYLATAKVWDGDFEKRVKRHQEERDGRWTNVEEQFELSKAIPDKRVVVVDCVTLWLTNYFTLYKSNRDESLKKAKEEFDRLKNYDGTLIIISNEIGMGLHAQTKMGRDFVELQGWMNQYIAKVANKAYFMVSGLPITAK